MAKLSWQQRHKMLMTKCQTRDELNTWIQFHLGLHLPDTIVSRYSDTNPLDVVWEVYRICVLNHNPENIKELLFVAGRGSGKTLGMAIVELMIVLHDKRDIVHVGAVMAQATRCYDYIKQFLYKESIKSIVKPPGVNEDNRILRSDNMARSSFNIDGQQVTLEVLPCTLKACNGPHVPLVVVDEIDTVSGEGLKAFKEISGMLDSKGTQRSLRVGISTRKSTYGLMNKQIENAEQQGRTVRRWTAFEFHERCPDERSGTKPKDLYVLQEDMDVVTEEKWLKKEPQQRREYIKYEMLDGCEKCPIASICLKDAKKQTTKSFMVKPIDDLIQKVLSEGADWALAQLMNLKPSMEGIIYREFDKRKHVLSWNQMWKRLTGKEFPGECNHDVFVQKCHDLKLQCYSGIDWGWTNPSTVVYFFVGPHDDIFIVRGDGTTQVSQPTWIHYLKNKYHRMYKCQMYFPDIADGGAVDEMKKAGLPVTSNIDKSIGPGIQVIKKFLRIPGSEDPKLFVAEETCEPLITEFNTYHFKLDAAGDSTEIPEDSMNHWLDALRYPMMSLFGKSTIILGSGVEYDSSRVVDSTGSFFKSPTIEEFAAAKGLNLDTSIDRSKLGKIGTATELDEANDEDGFGGDGGFLWSF